MWRGRPGRVILIRNTKEYIDLGLTISYLGRVLLRSNIGCSYNGFVLRRQISKICMRNANKLWLRCAMLQMPSNPDCPVYAK